MAALIAPARALSSEEPSTDVADTFSHVASLSSTPPTTVGDGMSITSETSKQEITVESTQVDITVSTTHNVPTFTAAVAVAAEQTPAPQVERIAEATAPLVDIDVPATPSTTVALTLDTPTSESSRPRRQRQSLPVYNLAKLSGTAVHGKRRANGDIVNEKKRRTISGPLPIDIEQQEQHGESPAQPILEALIKEVSSKKAPKKEVSASPMVKSAKNSKKRALSPEPPKRATRSTGMQAETLATKLSTLGKRGKKNFVQNLSKMTREMRRLQDTNEFSGIDTKPVLYTTWAKGKYVDPRVEPPAKKQKKAAEPVKDDTPEELAAVPQIPAPQRKVKKWMAHGLYSGQEGPLDYTRHLTPNEKKAIVDMPELIPSQTVNRVLPMPIFNGLRQLIQGRDFKLPFDICNPLPSGQPKPASWKLMTRNRFIGEAGALWKKSPHFKDYQSKCVCTAEDGCAESCQNRIMLYECDNTNCNAGAATCQNRAFARLQDRIKAGGKYRVGVEVVKTEDRGFGIRANRCFEPGQIIMEYTGEIITEEECEHRMEDKYKDNECYYLMSFDQNMIIDATRGSIARFVNHSCQPNSRMIKWIVSGQPRMALFAGDRPIMTGEELTYDYNFDPFSAKNVQKCLCGAPNCRGVLGPKPKEIKPPKPPKEELKKAVKKGLKAGKRKLQELLGDSADVAAGDAKKRKIKTPTGVKAKGSKATPSKAGTKVARAKLIKKSVSKVSVKSPQSGKKVASVKRMSSIVKTYTKSKAAGNLSASPKKAVAKKTATPKKTVTTKKSPAKKSAGTIAAGSATKKKASPAVKKTAIGKADTPKRGVGRPRKNAAASVSPRKGVDIARKAVGIRLVQSPSKAAEKENQPSIAEEVAQAA
ncbi:hypothetical protein E8E14_013561 [Neopestalotiopsis sp. 37M]|nr:hypothetical protein E8E14_013561 [Neopestalotiopsis sp. 37M]